MLTIISIIISITTTFGLNSSSTTTLTTDVDGCHDVCPQEKHAVQISTYYWFSPYIHYNLQNIECLLHQAFLSWFILYEFADTFEPCDIHLIYIHGGIENLTLCNNPPCLSSHSVSAQQLSAHIDGNTTMTIIPHNADIASSLESISLNSMAEAFERLFSNTFGVTIQVQIDVELQNEIQSAKAYLIMIPIILCILVCCGIVIVLYYFFKHKRNRASSQVSRQETDLDLDANYQTKTDRARDTIDYERQSITETSVLDATQMVDRANNPPMEPAVAAVGSHMVSSPFGGSYMPSSVGYRDNSLICAPQSYMLNNNEFNQFPQSQNIPSTLQPQMQYNVSGGNGISPNMGALPQSYDPIYAQQQQFGAAMGTFNEFNQFPQSYNQFPPQNMFVNENLFPPKQKNEYRIVDDSSSNATSSMCTFPVSDRNLGVETNDSSTIMTITNRKAPNTLLEESEERTATIDETDGSW